ncbi:MAG TPA: family 16 glycosylhydrolase [Kiritimatiellia bacterium]|nr:family 16 glycosylhydrolase [Kiritimatiellia bacterium]
MRTKRQAMLLCCAGLCAAASADEAVQSVDVQGPPAGKNWRLVWSDEFEGTAIDTQRWQNASPDAKWDYPGFQTRYASENCALDGKGSLVLSLTRDADGTVRFNNGLQSRTFEKAFGYFETRVQFSTQPGWWTAVWLAGVPYGEGTDTFQSPQEFDIFEDFYKPKAKSDISHCYHATASLGYYRDQGDGKGIGGTNMLVRTEIARCSKGKAVTLERYDGWHTVALEWSPLEHIFYVDGQETLRQSYRDVPVTTVPQRVWISECLRTPKKLKKDGGQNPFYGFLEDATFPDRLVVDYVRVYEEDCGKKTAPAVTVAMDGAPEEWRRDRPMTFHVRADDRDGTVKKVYLFSSGYLRAEADVPSSAPASGGSRFASLFVKRGHSVDQTFTVTNLFEADNTVIAMARDSDGLVGLSSPLRITVLSGREYTGTAYRGKPQSIPGRIVAGHYDEGGRGAAFQDNTDKGDPNASWRNAEIANSVESAIPVTARWVTYAVRMEESGEYDVELFMNRPDYGRKGKDFSAVPDDVVQMEVDRVKAAEWSLPAAWDSGHGFRNPLLPMGRRGVKLTAGDHQLIVRFDRARSPHTYFGGFTFTQKTAHLPGAIR